MQNFYESIGVPPPKLSPEERLVRRMMWRNDRTFYLRKCDLSGKQMVSIYPVKTPFPVYHPDDWYGDKWEPLKFGRDFDFSRPFFEQWHALMLQVPRLGIDIVNCENSYYCNYCGDDKNCYLDIAGEANEDSYFNLFIKYSKNCVDSTFVYNSELCYELLHSYNCYHVLYSMYLENCSDCSFCFDLKGCKNCLFCSNLRQKEYHILNKPCTREEYELKLKELNFGSYISMQKAIALFKDVMRKAIHRDMYNFNSENCTGDNIKNSKNCSFVFNASNCEDCMYLYDVLDAKDCQDLNYSLYHPEKSYELISTLSMKFCAFCMASHYCNNVYYCDMCNNSSDLFGCIGLNHKKYCILNKQYSQEEYEALKARITLHMQKTGEWGEFFPPEISPFGYNEVVANEYFPLTREEALQKGYRWAEKDPSNDYQGPRVDIPDNISDVPQDITKQILQCEISGKFYKITPHELKFYRQMNLPLPRRCPDQRHIDRMALRNPRRLWQRTCAKCGGAILTSYAPDRPEIVYCEECYLKEVY